MANNLVILRDLWPRKCQKPISTKNVMFLYKNVYICDIDLNLLKKDKQIEEEKNANSSPLKWPGQWAGGGVT